MSQSSAIYLPINPAPHRAVSTPQKVCVLTYSPGNCPVWQTSPQDLRKLPNYSTHFHSLPLWSLFKASMEKAIYLQGQIVREVFH